MEKWPKTKASARKSLAAWLVAGILLAALLIRFGLAEPAPAPPWNPANLAKIASRTEDPLAFAVLGDSRYSHGIFPHILRHIRADPELAFVIHVGDLVHRGKLREFQHFIGQVREFLRLPLVTTLGNHELDKDLAQPRQPYEALFGPRYYSFDLGRTYFLVLDIATPRDWTTSTGTGWKPSSPRPRPFNTACRQSNPERSLKIILQKCRNPARWFWASRASVPFM